MPLIQLNFPNPLNTSVQVGDTAYFSNPYPIAPPPVLPRDWASTVTPHLTNEKEDIKKIGLITSILPWNNVFSAIICDMPQDLFNQYFSEILAGGCTQTPGNPITSGDCGNYITANFVPSPSDINWQGTSAESGFNFFINNPTFSTQDYMVHTIAGLNYYVGSVPISDWCLIDASNPNYIPGYLNFWIHYDNGFNMFSGTFNTPSWQQLPSVYTYQDTLSGSGQYLGGFSASPVYGSYSNTYTEVCTPASFIMFSKDNKVNMSSLLGYYASVEFRNSSQEKAELFNVGVDFFESSK